MNKFKIIFFNFYILLIKLFSNLVYMSRVFYSASGQVKKLREDMADLPANNVQADKPANNVQADKPANNVQADKPANNVQADKPANSVQANKPANNLSDYFLDGNFKVSGSIMANKFLTESGKPIEIPENLDVKGNFKVNGQTELNKTNVKGDLVIEGPVDLKNGILKVKEIHLGNLKLTNTENSLRIQNEYGFIDIGTKNKDWGHIYTDRPKFALNKQITDVEATDSKNYVDYVKHTPNGGITLGKINLSDTENSLRIRNQSGFVDIGSKNNEWAHIYTDRPKFAVNKQITDVQAPDSKNYVDYIKRSTNGGIDMGSLNISNTKNSLRIKNEIGFIDIGAKNKDWAQIYTDRPKFALNKQIADVQNNDAFDYVKYNADGGINVNNFKITTKDKDLIFNNNDNNKTIMTMHHNGAITVYTRNGDNGGHVSNTLWWCDDKNYQCKK
jgi:hypothetical protein